MISRIRNMGPYIILVNIQAAITYLDLQLDLQCIQNSGLETLAFGIKAIMLGTVGISVVEKQKTWGQYETQFLK